MVGYFKILINKEFAFTTVPFNSNLPRAPSLKITDMRYLIQYYTIYLT